MNFLKKGPDLKLSGIKVPGFLQDVYYDLKDRHLLPIVALLIVAIVAVPIALSQSSSEGSEAGETAVPSGAGGQSAQLVAKSAPRLREYRRRLDHRQEEDPFQQQYGGAEPTAGGAEGDSASAPSETSSPSSESPEFSPAPEPTAPQTGGGPSGNPGKLTYFSYAIDVRISTGSTEEGGKKVTVRRNLPELTMLPSRETPAIVYMGSTKDGKKAVMTVSSDVEAIFGDGKCVLGSDTCQLLAMEPDLPETFVYGGSGRTFKIELLKIGLVESDKLNRAPLGKPQKGKSSKGDG